MQHTKHIWRAAIILVFAALTGIAGRELMIPKSFGETGWFRHDNIGEHMEQTPLHGGDGSCKKCHSDQYDTKMAGKHVSVPCETCHAPVAGHADADKKIADMPSHPAYELCALCHEKQIAKPADFPQVDLAAHLKDKDMPIKDKIPAKACMLCHQPHDPGQE